MSSAETNTPEFSVSELANSLKRTVEDAYGHVRVRGELGRVIIARSGHAYLDLKDDKAVIDGVMWKGMVERLNFKPEEGLEVVCEGKLTTYPGRSKYQIIIERMEPAGAGALMALLEDRKKKLAAEGLFEASRKKAIPVLPKVIGVVTSPTGAVIRDILHRLEDRFPRHVLLWPVLVQGDAAAGQIAAAIRGFNALDGNGSIPRPDVLIVARGGGSVEDLWCFNDEDVVRAAAESDIPLISAVGHETDTTLIDFASDRRAPTPTGAAEMAVPVRADLMQDVRSQGERLTRSLTRLISQRSSEFRATARAFPTPQNLLGTSRQRLDLAAAGLRPEALRRDILIKTERVSANGQRLQSSLRRQSRLGSENLSRIMERLRRASPTRQMQRSSGDIGKLTDRLRRAGAKLMDRKQRDLASVAARHALLGHDSVLQRGYALVRNVDGGLVRSASQAHPGEAVSIQFADGKTEAVIGSGGPVRKKAKPRQPASPEKQGRLF
ncbi:exodeoxyribonuclease VII large subunit [Hyphobacterium sp. HN65]|uniref:Exodeoxyribonuclease 7 large subunit n=1 Tax=Hyphobacterium lacteum TaxID=3116575 RepID=A0ABU7LP28_9PROT|nr:exodeoxyribonuclease VII large subunit [Hyphobacterium sp. HN65]MEE2525354.1 exodeoxyribonuclease VII large subunit [Hyphobacterium sp. HN65]